MTRKMACVGFSYLLGLFSASFFVGLSGSYLLVAAIVFAVLLSCYVINGKSEKKVAVVVCLISFFIGASFYIAYENVVYKNIVKYDGEEVFVIGKVTAYSNHPGDKSRYQIKGTLNGEVAAEVVFFADTVNVRLGDTLIIRGTAAAFEDNFLFKSKTYNKSKGTYLEIKKISHFEFFESPSSSL